MTTALWQQHYTLFGQGLAVSTLIASIPVLLLLFLLGVRRKPAWVAASWGLAATFLLVLFAYEMPVGPAVSSIANGAAFGLFPISWIVLWSLALYRVTTETGTFEVIKDCIGSITDDPSLQALLIGFCFGAFIEGAAGFGTPVAVAAAMLTGLGFSPFRAAAVCLLANTAPVAFGSIGIPVITLAGITGFPVDRLSEDVGRISAPLAFLIPAYLIAAMSGWKGLRRVWPAALTVGGTFALVQFTVSNFIGPQLADIMSSLAATLALIALLRFWKPVPSLNPEDMPRTPKRVHYTTGQIVRAWTPYGFLVLFVLLWGFKPVQGLLNSVTYVWSWPFLHNLVQRVPPIVPRPSAAPAIYNVNWLAAAGTACMLATLCSVILLGMKPRAFGRLFAALLRTLAIPTLTVSLILGMAFLMNYSGATGTLGLAFAGTGAAFPFFSAVLGWIGVFLTGSDTSSNALFGTLQSVTATRLGLPPILMAAANSSGGVMGKMISLQTIAVAAAATGMSISDQAKLFRFTFRHSVLLAAVAGLLVLFYTYGLKLT